MPKEMKKRVLLSAEDKRAFFEQLDAFAPFTAPPPRRAEADTNNATTTATATSPSSVMTPSAENVPMGRGGGPTDSVIVIDEDNGEQRDQEQVLMGRTLPLSCGKRRSTDNVSVPSKEKTKRRKSDAKRANRFEPKDMLLLSKRVLLVPIGSDVSRKRLEIWQDMVQALGGSVVLSAGVATTKDATPLLHLTSARKVSTDTEQDTPQASFDWSSVDMVIVSGHVDMDKLRHHYKCSSPPATVKMYTPEWLVRVRQEKQRPQNEAEYDWRKRLEVSAQGADEGDDDDEALGKQGREDGDDSEDENGSDRRNVTSNEIVRAPPVEIDAEAISREEEELVKKKAKLVNERIPIFHQLNPRFETIATAQEGRKLKMDAFVCQKSSLMQTNLNAHLTDPLEELMEFLHVERDIWREYSYKKIVSSLKAMRTRVSSVRDLKGLWWAKGRMREKVVELLETGKLEKLEAKKVNPRLRALVEMSRIWGVGPATAAKLYNQGYNTLDALRANTDVLNFQQQIGLKHYQDFLTKIPRAEVQEIEKMVVDEVHRLLPNAIALACGSYRRGRPSSGDVDVLITDPDSEECDILPELLRRLHESGFLTNDLTHISDHRMGRCDSYMGVCRLGEGHLYRRLDIKVYPRRFFGFALLFFTGSDHFNRSMRLFARKKGWSLSDRSLKRVVRVKKGVKLESGESVVCQSEVDVFIALGLEYKDPTERNCFDIRFLAEDEEAAKKGKRAAVDEPGNDAEQD